MKKEQVGDAILIINEPESEVFILPVSNRHRFSDFKILKTEIIRSESVKLKYIGVK